jgi:hypothetical protein
VKKAENIKKNAGAVSESEPGLLPKALKNAEVKKCGYYL